VGADLQNLLDVTLNFVVGTGLSLLLQRYTTKRASNQVDQSESVFVELAFGSLGADE